jgi:histidinol dehydrogenase
MPQRLKTQDPDFEQGFSAFLAQKREVSEDVDAAVRAILADVRDKGDVAVHALTQKFDRFDPATLALRVPVDEIVEAYQSCEPGLRDALEFAHARILSHHERQRPSDDRYQDATGAELGHRWTAVPSVGLYVPGGTASYPSSVLMNAVPAKVAGVARIVMVVPAPGGVLNPLVLAAGRIAGVDEIYRIGGAQAVAALAYGTETIAPVAKIVGPGNAYVAAAKRQVFGTVGIDSIAGPSEVLIIADADNDPDWIAADLLAQAEHDTAAQSILMTDDPDFADAVVAAVAHQLAVLPRGEIAGASWRDFGAVILLSSLDEAPALADRIAAEHLEIATTDCEVMAARISNAGAIFLGAYTPEVIGDYVGGSNHVLPTARSARFSSGLGVLDFMKRTSILKLTPNALAALGDPAMILAAGEGLDAHRRSVAVRLSGKPPDVDL